MLIARFVCTTLCYALHLLGQDVLYALGLPVVPAHRKHGRVPPRPLLLSSPQTFLPVRQDALPAHHAFQPEPEPLRDAHRGGVLRVRLPLQAAQAQVAHAVAHEQARGVARDVRAMPAREDEEEPDLGEEVLRARVQQADEPGVRAGGRVEDGEEGGGARAVDARGVPRVEVRARRPGRPGEVAVQFRMRDDVVYERDVRGPQLLWSRSKGITCHDGRKIGYVKYFQSHSVVEQ